MSTALELFKAFMTIVVIFGAFVFVNDWIERRTQ